MNGWTTLVMGAAGAGLIILSMLPRVGRRRGAAPAAIEERQNRRFDRDREPVTERERVAAGDRATMADDRAPTTPHGSVAASEHRAAPLDDRR